eukprot:TRINITY_DN66655_c5_g6_i3.p1 TRINITY_DN66655_c5_g6~~TRINITY_DN66655_c5_g6_i3.p1  ORF type:complete len:1205 (+),score=113.83 TRINITY_DN66655_c5_g6_i3:373-3615(+)
MAVTVPPEATHITVRRPSKEEPMASVQHHVRIPSHAVLAKKFATQATASEESGADGPAIRVRTVETQVGHPDKHKNLVFVAAGFTKEEEVLFRAIVTGAREFLQYTSAAFSASLNPLWISSPWDRYMPLINIFAVFQASKDSGASVPLRSDGTPHSGFEDAVDKKNNLDCTYGSDTLRFLSCDPQKALALASETPANPESSIVITLVNDIYYGGTGGGNKAYVYVGEWTKLASPEDGDHLEVCTEDIEVAACPTEKKAYYQMGEKNNFFQVLLHELGHADAQLADEYAYNVDTKDTQQLPNCFRGETDPPWKHWIGKSLGTGEPTVEPRPPPSYCSYDGYFKPTPDLCVMNMQRNELCPVCAENVILSLYQDIQELASPRCPREDETMVVVLNDDTHFLSVDPAFIDGPAGIGRADSGLYSRAHSLPVDGESPYPECQVKEVRERFVRRATDNLGQDPPLCHDKLKKIPVRKDEGDISVLWEWPEKTAANLVKPPKAIANPKDTVNGAVAQPWKLDESGKWVMEGHLTELETDGKRRINIGSAGAGEKILPVLEFQPTLLGEGLHEFKLTITDHTDFVQKNAWPTPDLDDEQIKAVEEAIDRMASTTTFRVRVVLPNDADFSHCDSTLSSKPEFWEDADDRASFSTNECPPYAGLSVVGLHRQYCGVCDAGAVCNDTYPVQLFQVEADIQAALQGVEDLLTNWVGVVILAVFATLIIIITIVGKCTAWYKDEIRDLPVFIQIGRWLMILTAILTMLLSIGVCVVGALNYSDLTVVGRSMAILAGIGAALLFLIGYTGFIAALLRSRVLLVLNGILLFLIVAFLVALVYVSFRINNEISASAEDDTEVESFLVTEWERQIVANPKFMCTFQSTFECSGLTISCHNKFHSQCSPDCQRTNSQNVNPCLEKARIKWQQYFKPIAAGSVGMLIAMFLGLIFNWALCCYIRKYKPNQNARVTPAAEKDKQAKEKEKRQREEESQRALMDSLRRREAKEAKSRSHPPNSNNGTCNSTRSPANIQVQSKDKSAEGTTSTSPPPKNPLAPTSANTDVPPPQSCTEPPKVKKSGHEEPTVNAWGSDTEK